MNFDTGTWWLIGIISTALIGSVTYLIKRGVFGRVDECQETLGSCVRKEDFTREVREIKAEVKQIRENYTPQTIHTKDIDECRGDIKQIKEDYITREDFFRVQSMTDRKLDKIMDILLEMKGGKKGE